MSITEIEAAPTGTTMTVTRNNGDEAITWERRENGWHEPTSGVTLTSTFFQTPAEQGLVTLGTPEVPMGGVEAALPRYRVTNARVAGIPEGVYPVVERAATDQLVILPEDSRDGWVMTHGAVTGIPDELLGRRAWWVGRHHLTLVEPENTEVVCTRNHAEPCTLTHVEPGTVEGALREQRDRIQAALHQYLDEHEYDRGSDLEELMTDVLNMEARPRERETITVEVNISGHTNIDLGDSDLCQYVDPHDRITVNDATVRASWDWTVGVEVEVDEGDCGCDDVDYDAVREVLCREDITFEDFDIDDTSCPND